jgi:hypothetical protein
MNPQRNTIPVLEIKDPKSIEALKLLSKSHDMSDITVLSKSDDYSSLRIKLYLRFEQH